ncbi:MAG: hypothetical protein R3F49_21740 [Planctomycetota bacterium]
MDHSTLPQPSSGAELGAPIHAEPHALAARLAAALVDPDAARSNREITALHFDLGRALGAALGGACGANFHCWAVWGSRKAGVTIRQEDLERALLDATIVAGAVGAIVGASGALAFGWPALLVLGSVALGFATGAWTGRAIARWSRRRASQLILEGNRTVLEDIGSRTITYLRALDLGSPEAMAAFRASFRRGPTEAGGQDLLAEAFARYEAARVAQDPARRCEDVYFANCLAVLHEHIRLDPLIRRSMPFIVRKCVTKRLMTYDVGRSVYSVREDAPAFGATPFPPELEELRDDRVREFLSGERGFGLHLDSLQGTRARDWTRLEERMRYVFQLFRAKHTDPEVWSTP